MVHGPVLLIYSPTRWVCRVLAKIKIPSSGICVENSYICTYNTDNNYVNSIPLIITRRDLNRGGGGVKGVSACLDSQEAAFGI